MNYKVIVAHPGRQHSFRLASALKKNGMLYRYITTIYDKEDSKLEKIVKLFLSENNRKRLKNRRNKDLIDEEVVQFCKLGGLLELLLYRIDKSKKIYRFIQRYNVRRIGEKIAKYAIKNNVDVVVCYDSNAYACFDYLKRNKSSIIKILDVSIIARPYMKRVYEIECQNSKTNYLYKDNLYLWNNKIMEKLQSEIDNSDYFLAASSVVKDSLIYSGVKEEQIKVIPYGSNILVNSNQNKKNKNQVRFLFVGQVVYRKGITYLLSCMEELKEAELVVTGNFNDEEYLKEYKKLDNIKFTGLVTLESMKKIYQESDVFIIPSFAEGMAQVGIEAMTCGLPVICTYNSGVSDLIEEGKNGFVIPIGNKEKLLDRMKWFINNKEKIVEMGEEAKKISQNYTWENYEKNIDKAFKEILNEK